MTTASATPHQPAWVVCYRCRQVFQVPNRELREVGCRACGKLIYLCDEGQSSHQRGKGAR